MKRYDARLFAIVAFFTVVQSATALADPTMGVPVTETQNSASPVTVNECKLKYAGGLIVGTSAGISIQFTNESNQEADIINFRVTAGSQGGVIRDVGSFAPGIEISHSYRTGDGQMMFSPILSHPNLVCTVDSVHFKDGTVWRPGQPSAAASPASTASVPPGPLAASIDKLAFTATGEAYSSLFTVSAQTATKLTENDNCMGIANVTTISTTASQIALKATPIGQGVCGIDVRDAAGHTLVVPVGVTAGQ